MQSTLSIDSALLEEARHMLIGGALVGAGETMPVESPGDGTVIAEVPAASAQDVSRAIAAAAAAFPAWRHSDIMLRRQKLLDLARLVRENAEVLAQLDAIDSGSPVASMRKDIAGAIFNLEWVAGLAFSWGGQTPVTSGQGIDLTLREPYGVTARIIPFNHPFYFLCKIAAPLITGNTVVAKLPDQTPLSGLWLAGKIASLFPPGVLNIITGTGRVAGDTLVRDERVARIAFTGSVPTGRHIHAIAAQRFAPTSMELGGKNPMIVCPDADLDHAAHIAVSGMNYNNQGQSCGSYSRLFVHEDVHDEMIERVAALIDKLAIGHPLDENAQMGALIDCRARDRSEEYVGSAISEGARLVTGGDRPQAAELQHGWYVRPALVQGVDMGMRIAREEIFGPVQSVLRWSRVDDVIAAANATEFGLTANICTQDIDRALYMTRRIDSGIVTINGEGGSHFPGAPFGGFKSSGIGKEESLDELLETTREKNVYLNIRYKPDHD